MKNKEKIMLSDLKEAREFCIENLFEKADLKWIANRKFSKKRDLSTEQTKEFMLPLCNAKFGNNGIMYFGRDEDFNCAMGGLDIVNDGAISTGSVYPQPHRIGVLYNAYVVVLKNGKKDRSLLNYLACVVEKAIKHKFGYDNKATWAKVKSLEIILPIETDAEGTPIIDPERKYHAEGYIPDWSYMQERIAELEQERIAELEQERIAELEQYLVAAGLNDYELNDEDNAALISSKNMADFNLAVLFNISKGKRLTKKDQTKGNTPFIGSCDSNNGVTGYIGQPPLFEENAITISYNGSVGQVFYQEKPFWASDDINVLYLKNHTLNRDLFGYLGAALYKVGKQFSYTYKWNLARMKRSVIKLPIQTNEEGHPIIDPERKYHAEGYIPDWDYMTAYIRAMKKVVIADVVKYKDEVIAKTRSLISTE